MFHKNKYYLERWMLYKRNLLMCFLFGFELHLFTFEILSEWLFICIGCFLQCY